MWKDYPKNAASKKQLERLPERAPQAKILECPKVGRLFWKIVCKSKAQAKQLKKLVEKTILNKHKRVPLGGTLTKCAP